MWFCLYIKFGILNKIASKHTTLNNYGCAWVVVVIIVQNGKKGLSLNYGWAYFHFKLC